jgi:uncharacterized radical SAM protein YgiQ
MTSPDRFLPTTLSEMHARGWDALDVLLVTGDAYVDHPSFGTAVIARVLEAEGYKVGVIAQPDWTNPEALNVMGRPRLFCGITAGNLDSMLSHYTAARHKRHEDSYTPGGAAGKRPNMATVVYSQLARRVFPKLPIVLGGIEASLRRIVHYDYWQDKIRASVLQESRADLLVYGMGERAVREIAKRIDSGESLAGIGGTARFLGAKESVESDFSAHVLLDSFEVCKADRSALLRITRLAEREQNPFCGKPLVQWHGDRALVVERPAVPLSSSELDAVYDLAFTRESHPSIKEPIPAHTMIRDSVTVLRGCGGGCSFCGLGLHQGRFLSSRSEASVAREVTRMTQDRGFHGTVTDLGGPTANLYGCVNGEKEACRKCHRSSCLFPRICPNLEINAEPSLKLLRRIRKIDRVKHVFVQSGIRMEVALAQPGYIQELVSHHVSGHLKIAPEHLHPDVLKKMRKPGADVFNAFREAFDSECKTAGKEYYMVPYFISNFPGSTAEQMASVETMVRDEHWKLQQVQDFIPLPMTAAAAMYYSGLDYETGEPIPVNRGLGERREQRNQLQPHTQKPLTGNPYKRNVSRK